jgi:hypothetical protein
MNPSEIVKAVQAILATLAAPNDWDEETEELCVNLIARLKEEPEPVVLAKGVGAEYGHTGVWMVWGGELGQLPWTQDRSVRARPVLIVERP